MRKLLTVPQLSSAGLAVHVVCSFDSMIARYKVGGTPDILKRVEELAKKKGVSMTQIGVAWHLHKEFVTAPIVGTTKLENLVDILGACFVALAMISM